MRIPAMKKIGLTGGMGTGKSTVMWMFQDMGANIINADEISHQLLEPKSAVWKLLFERYGTRIMQQEHVINRAILADIIFGDEEERIYVERAIHPRVHEEISKLLTHLERANAPYAIVEIPLLFETGWEKDYDTIVVVRCDIEQQIARCMEKFNLAREEALQRIKLQRPLDDKVAKADFVVDNAGSTTETHVQVHRLFKLFERGEFKPRLGGRSPSA